MGGVGSKRGLLIVIKSIASEIATQGLTNADELPAWYLFLLKVIADFT